MPPKQSDRSANVEAKFGAAEVKDGKLFFPCCVGTCTEKVQCYVGKGAPGRISHLRYAHKEVFNALPAARTYNKKPPQAAQIAQQQGNVPNADHEPNTQAANIAKRQREDDMVDYFARTLQPFVNADDPYFHGIDVTRRNVVEKLELRLAALQNQFAQGHPKHFCSVSIDSGTNIRRTLDVCFRLRCVSRFLRALRISEQTGVNVSNAVQECSKLLDVLTVAAFVSDKGFREFQTRGEFTKL